MSIVLALNCGSSSLKFALFEGEQALHRGSLERVGAGGAKGHAEAVQEVFDTLETRRLPGPDAVGHRLVHGGPEHTEPARVSEPLLASLQRAVPFAPLHLPAELSAVEAVRERYGAMPQVVCFDTSFHRTLPPLAYRYALPEALFAAGVRRYGFHGLSYEYLVESLGAAALGRAVLAHLGSGASMVAVHGGRSIDTTMGFTPAGGLVMGTRAGDLDPGLLVYLLEHKGHDARSLERLVNHESGLLGLSGTSSDMRVLLSARAHDPRAALAVDVFCYQARKWLGAFTAALGGLDTVVFTGGIGAHSSVVRAELCRGLGVLGVTLDDARNAENAAVISAHGPCCVRVLETDEERIVARRTRQVLEGT